MIQYLLWQTLTSRHTNITLSFLPVGHTKFAPDWCFGLFKRGYRRTKVGTLQSIAEVVNNSAECNTAQVVSHENGRIIVPSYNWTDFFATRMKKIIGIKRFHHFRMAASSPGVVFVKQWSDSSEEELMLKKNPGFNSSQQSYLPPSSLPDSALTVSGICTKVSGHFVQRKTRTLFVHYHQHQSHPAEGGLQFRSVKMAGKIRGQHQSDFEGFVFAAFVIKKVIIVKHAQVNKNIETYPHVHAITYNLYHWNWNTVYCLWHIVLYIFESYSTCFMYYSYVDVGKVMIIIYT